MVTKGIITSIDFNGNTCKVRIPFFETAGNDPIVGDAIISNTPGSYNGYKVNDVVLVAFEDGQMNNPVIIGKLYLGAAREKQDPRGTINAETTNASKSASLPADSTLTANVDSNVPNTNTPYGSLASIANNLNSLNTDVNQLDKFTRNQFNSIITEMGEDGELWTAIKQNAREITLEAGRRKEGDDGLAEDYNAKFSVQDTKIDARVTKTLDVDDNHWEEGGKVVGFGWNLTDKDWTVQSYDSSHQGAKTIDIFKVDNSGVTIAGDLKLVGYPSITVTKYANVPADWYKSTGPRPGWITIDGTTSSAKAPNYDSLETITDLVWTQEDVDAAPEDAPVVLNEKVWQEDQPAFNDNYYTWKLTYCLTYEYNSDTGLLDEILANQSVFCIYYKIKSSGPEPHDRRPPRRDEISLAEVYEIARTAKGTAEDAVELANDAADAASDAADAAAAAHTIAQGKTTNYYSSLEPYAADTAPSGYLAAPNLKKGDCWFDTSSSNKRNTATIVIDGTETSWSLQSESDSWPNVYRFDLANAGKDRYRDSSQDSGNVHHRGIAKVSKGGWLEIGGFSSIKNLILTFKDEYNKTTAALVILVPKTERFNDQPINSVDRLKAWLANDPITIIYETTNTAKNLLKQAKTDPDSSTHLVEWEDIGGELVANKITANYINALDITTKKITVLNDDVNQKILFKADGTGSTGEVTIGNFKVDPYGLIFGENGSTRQFSLKNFTTQLQAYTHTQAIPNSTDITVAMKVTITKDNAYFKFFIDSLCSYGIEANHYLIVSNLNTSSVPTDPTSGEVYYTNDNNLYFTNYSDSSYTSHETIYGKIDDAIPVVFKNVKANDFFYIVFRLNASTDPGYGHTINSQAIAYIPQNDTCTISDVSGKSAWTRDSSKDTAVENTTLGIGNKFNVTDDGTLMARTGLFGPWMLTSEKLAYNYHDYTYNNKYKPYLTDAGNAKKKYASAYKYNNAAYWNGDGLILSTKKILDKATTGWEDYFGPEEVTVGTEISAGGGVESTRIVRKLWSDRLKSGIPGFKGFPVICNINNAVSITSNSTNPPQAKDVVTTVDAICTIKVDSNSGSWTKLPRSAYANIVPFFGFIVKTNLNDYAIISATGVRIKTRNVADDGETPIADTITEVEYTLAGSGGHGTVVLFGKAIGGIVGDN